MKKRHPIKQTLYPVLENATWGGNAYMGILLHDMYPRDITIILPSYLKVASVEERAAGKNFNLNGMLSQGLLSLFAYPTKIEFKRYNFQMDSKGREYLLKKTFRSETLGNQKYHFLKNQGSTDIVFYSYKNEFFFIPSMKDSWQEP